MFQNQSKPTRYALYILRETAQLHIAYETDPHKPMEFMLEEAARTRGGMNWLYDQMTPDEVADGHRQYHAMYPIWRTDPTLQHLFEFETLLREA